MFYKVVARRRTSRSRNLLQTFFNLLACFVGIRCESYTQNYFFFFRVCNNYVKSIQKRLPELLVENECASYTLLVIM